MLRNFVPISNHYKGNCAEKMTCHFLWYFKAFHTMAQNIFYMDTIFETFWKIQIFIHEILIIPDHTHFFITINASWFRYFYPRPLKIQNGQLHTHFINIYEWYGLNEQEIHQNVFCFVLFLVNLFYRDAGSPYQHSNTP